MMTTTPSYDFISSLRVLYRRRRMIALGTCLTTLAVAIVSLIWPQTWRAESHILVTTPKFKEELTLLSRPMDVVTYRSLLVDQSMLSTVLDRLRWIHTALHTMLDTPAKKKILLENLNLKEGEIDNFTLIRRTSVSKLARVLYEGSTELYAQGDKSEGLKNPLDDRVQRLRLLAAMNADEIQAAFEIDKGDLQDLTLFDLRKMLTATVTKVKETNLETIYSQIIDVRGEFDTAAGAKMITNLWIRSFLDRAERIARSEVLKRTDQVTRRSQQIDRDLTTAYDSLSALRATTGIDDLKAQLATKRLLLYGVAEKRNERAGRENEFNLEEESMPFLTERLRHESLRQFEMQANFKEALLPQLSQVERALKGKQNLLHRLKSKESEFLGSKDLYVELPAKIAQLETARDEIRNQIQSLVIEIKELRGEIESGEAQLVALRRKIEKLENQATGHQRFVQEAGLLLGDLQEGQRFTDAQGGTAVKPDKRVFPKRTLMTAIGMIVSFLLFCALAFFLEIWPKITADNP